MNSLKQRVDELMYALDSGNRIFTGNKSIKCHDNEYTISSLDVEWNDNISIYQTHNKEEIRGYIINDLLN